jgi:hypothetical protein
VIERVIDHGFAHGGLVLHDARAIDPLGHTSFVPVRLPSTAASPQQPFLSFLKHASSLGAGGSGSALIGGLPGLPGLLGSDEALGSGVALGADDDAATVLAADSGTGAPVETPIGSYATGGRRGGSAHAAPSTTTSMEARATLTASKH